MAVEKIRKGKRKRYKLCREEMDITEEVKIVGLLLLIKVLHVYINFGTAAVNKDFVCNYI